MVPSLRRPAGDPEAFPKDDSMPEAADKFGRLGRLPRSIRQTSLAVSSVGWPSWLARSNIFSNSLFTFASKSVPIS